MPGTVVDRFREAVAAHPDRDAFVDGTARLSFGEWDRWADGAAAALADAGVRHGDVVCVRLSSCVEYAVVYQAAMRLGAITTGVNPRLGPQEVDTILRQADPRVVVDDAARVRSWRALDGLPASRLPSLRPHDPVAIVWTSGTTGSPKGAVFDHANLEAMARAAGPLSAPGDRRLSPLPFSHVGFMTRVWDELVHGITTVVVPTPWTAADALRLIEAERVTVAQGVPTQWQLMLAHPDLDGVDTSSLRLAASGAAPVPAALVREIRRRLRVPVVVRYTSTEACVTTGTRVDDPDDVVAYTVGRPNDGVELDVAAPPGEVGVVRCRSGAVMRGYWRDPQRTAEVLDDEGWLTTDDLGRLDDRGNLVLLGRRSDRYVRGGYNVYPGEVEAVLSEHPSVARVAVVGGPDPVLGEIGHAFVVPAVTARSAPTLDDLRAWCAARLADYKAPDRLHLVDALPVTAMQKIDKRALAAGLATDRPAHSERGHIVTVEGRTLWELVERRAAATPDARMALDDRGRAMTFADYRDRCERVAAGLAARGIGPDVHVSWQLPTWLESLVLVGALARLGAVQNPLLPIYRHREVGFALRQTGAHLFVVPPAWRGFDYPAMAAELAAEVAGPGCSVLVCDRDDHPLPEGDPSTLGPAPATPDDPAALPVRWVFYTSGTTADPKGAQHTDRTVMAAAEAMSLALDLRSDDVGALVFPFTHIGGITWLMAGLRTGCFQLIVEAFDPATTIPFMAEHDVTLAGAGTPFHLAYLNHQRATGGPSVFPHVRAYPGGAAPKPPQLHYDLKAEIGGVGIVSGYGLTECPILAMNKVSDPDEKLATTEGCPTPGVTLRIVTLEGKPAGPGEDGEIRVRGPQLFRGYLDAALDADAFDEEGFFRTGDLGNQDVDGFVTITGRLKDIIIRNGENISAKEIEDLLYQHPKVADVAVIGLPDPQVGERCCAVVASNDPADPLTFDEMIDFLKERRLMTQKLPERLETVDTVPRNPTGKILKHKLRELYATKGA